MWKYLISLLSVVRKILKSKYKWILIFFILWLYRVDFIADTGGGLGKLLQVVTLFGMLWLVTKYKPSIISKTLQLQFAPIKSLLYLYCFALLSSLWAFDPTFAFFLSFQNIVLLFILTWMFTHCGNFISMERTFIYLTILSMLFEVITLRVLHPSFFVHFLPGGSSAAICLSYCIGELISMRRKDFKRRHFLKNNAIIAFIVLITSTSSGANASAVIGIGVALTLSGKIKYALPVLLGGIVLYFNQHWLDDIILFIMPGKTKEIIEIGNGRDTIWEGIRAVTAQRPLYGWGYACGERVASRYLNWTLSDAHNNYIGLYGGLGLIGVILFIYHQMVSTIHFLRNRKYIGFIGLISAFCCASVNGYSYGYLSGKACSITIIYMAILVFSFTYIALKQHARQTH